MSEKGVPRFNLTGGKAMTVAAKEKGTMTEEKSREKSPPASEVKTPASEKVSSEGLYTQEQVDTLIHAAKSEVGRRAKEVEGERDTLKSQITSFESKLQDIESDRDALQQEIEDLSSNDPKRFDLIKKDKEMRDKERQLKTRISDLDGREQSLSEREKKVSGFEREVLIEEIADEYEDGDKAKLEKALSAFDSPTEDQIRIIADVIFSKKNASSPEEPTRPFVGRQAGGLAFIRDRNNPTETLKHAFRNLKQRTEEVNSEYTDRT